MMNKIITYLKCVYLVYKRTFQILKLWYIFKNALWYTNDYIHLQTIAKDDDSLSLKDSFPCLFDRNSESGSISQYMLQDLLVAQKIFVNNPFKHVDVGSRIDGLVASVAAFRDIEVFDIRPLSHKIPNVLFIQADLTDTSVLPENYCDSISCLHAIEHFGLGRYGDALDINGHRKGFANITRILSPGGIFYFSVPMGGARIEFNAHRIFDMRYLINWVTEDFEIVSFSYIDDSSNLYKDVVITEEVINNSFGCSYGVAIFELKKK